MSDSYPNRSSTDHESFSSPAAGSKLVDQLCSAEAYPDRPTTPIVLHETHVSWVFLAGDHAYKVKKPLTTSFLDYGTLSKREHFCHQEYRLNRRYAPDLYLGVVAITSEQGHLRVEGRGNPVEFAVKMKRFPEDALLSRRLESGKIANEEVFQLAGAVAGFHREAEPLHGDQPWGSPSLVFQEAIDNFDDFIRAFQGHELSPSSTARLASLRNWTEQSYQQLRALLTRRREQGFIRECHGDLHLANVIRWQGRWTPFDGIEFNEAFRWIDILSDAAFLAMDFAAEDHWDLAHSFLNAYLEETGDYAAIRLLQWYLVYRAMVRAKVAAIRSQQSGQATGDQAKERQEALEHVVLASRLAERHPPRLWITHGVSGSGKTTGSEYLVQQQGAIRIRSDVERKRLFHLASSQRPDEVTQEKMYSSSASARTYDHLRELAESLLRDGQSVIVDATFLRQRDRETFRQLAASTGASFHIVPFSAERAELERRIVHRRQQDRDASDANLQVLQSQLEKIEPLTSGERECVENPPQTVDHLH